MKKSKAENRLGKNIFSLFVLQGTNYLLPLITLPYLVRVLGPEKYGLIAFTLSFITYFTVFVDYGFNLSATREISRNRDDHEKVSAIFSTVMIIKLAFMLVGFILLYVIAGFWPTLGKEWTLASVVYLAVAGNALFPIWFFQGMEDMKTISVVSILAKVLVVAGIFLLVHKESDYILAACLQSSSILIAGFISMTIILGKSRITPVLPGASQIMAQLREGWHVFTSTAAMTLYSNSNIFILGLITNNVIVGYYSAAEQLVKAVQGLMTPISQAIYPHISQMVDRSREMALKFIHKAFVRIGLLSFLLSFLLFILAEPLVLFILGDKFTHSVAILRVLAFIPFLVALSNVLGIQTMLTFGLKKEFSRIIIISGVINIALIIPLVYLYGGTGAATSVLLTELFVTALMAYRLDRNGLTSAFNGNKQWT